MSITKKIWTGTVDFFSSEELTQPELSDFVDLESEGYEGIQIKITGWFSACPHNLICELSGSIDGVRADDIPLMAMTLYKKTYNETAFSFIIKNITGFRVKFSQSQTPSGFITVLGQYRAWKQQNL